VGSDSFYVDYAAELVFEFMQCNQKIVTFDIGDIYYSSANHQSDYAFLENRFYFNIANLFYCCISSIWVDGLDYIKNPCGK
jgi:hypothetical protein